MVKYTSSGHRDALGRQSDGPCYVRGSSGVTAQRSVKMEFRKLKLCMAEWQRQAYGWSYISVRSGRRQDDPLVFFVRANTRISAFAAITLESCARNAHTGALNKGDR